MPLTQNETGYGKRLIGSLHSADVSQGRRIPLFERISGDAFSFVSTYSLRIQALELVSVPGGDCQVFWDLLGVGNPLPVAEADAAGNWFKSAGDVTGVLDTDDEFIVTASTGNDGHYTVVSSSYSAADDQTTVNVASVADGTDDGYIVVEHYDVASATAASNTLTIAGDYSDIFTVGRSFLIEGSTGNDGGYTVETVSVASSVTTITVGSLADSTDDGYIVALPTWYPERSIARGTIGANAQVSIDELGDPIEGPVGMVPYVDAPAGVTDVTFTGLLKANISRSP